MPELRASDFECEGQRCQEYQRSDGDVEERTVPKIATTFADKIEEDDAEDGCQGKGDCLNQEDAATDQPRKSKQRSCQAGPKRGDPEFAARDVERESDADPDDEAEDPSGVGEDGDDVLGSGGVLTRACAL